MRYGRPGIISTIAVILVGVLSLGAGAPAYAAAGQARPRLAAAAPTVTVSPASDNPGAMVTVSGSGFAANEPVTLSFDANPTYSTKAQATASGQLPATAFTIPAVSGAGAHSITATGTTSGHTTTVGLTVAPPRAITVSPASGNAGSMVTVSGSGFAANETVTLAFDANPTYSVKAQATAAGLLPATTFTIPAVSGTGAHSIVASGEASGHTATAGLTVTPGPGVAAPAISVSPASGNAGSMVTISGGGFAANATVTLAFDATPAHSSKAQATAAGQLPATAFTVPPASGAGAHNITVTGATSGHTTTAGLTIAPPRAITVSPASGNPGAVVMVSGSGFAANETVTLAFDANPAFSSKVQATAAGLLPATAFAIPAVSGAGAHAVVATGATSGRKATAGLTVTPAPSSAATLTVAPGATTRGGAVSISGGGFTPNEAVELTIDGVSTPLTTLHADASGALPATTITIPYAATAGAHTLTARGATSGKMATAALTLNAVTATLTVTPASSTRGGAVTVSGGGFAAGESVTITIDGVGEPLAIARTGATGLLSPTSLTIPYTATVGAHTLTATGEVSGRKATAPLTLTAVVATVSLVPTTTNRGGLLTISGANFAAGEAVTVTADGVITPLATITATAQGLLPPTGVSVPYALATGPHTLRLTGATSGRAATAPFTVAPLAPRIVATPATASPSTVVTVSGSGFGRQERITLALNGAALPTIPTVITTTNGGFTASFTATQSLLSGVNTIGAIGNESRVSAISGLAGSLPVAGMLYFAGASTLPGETASLPILNTNAQRTHVILTFYYQHGAPGQTAFDVPAHSRFTADLNALAGAGRVFGVALSADRAVTAQLREARQGRDGFGLLGVSAPSTTWYLAEGFTGLTFHETVALVNPGQISSQVQVRLLPFGGRAARTELVTVPGQSTRTVDVNSLMPRQSLSVIATASSPIVVARTLTFSSHNGVQGYGATAKTGTNTPATTWIFAEGTTTTRFQTYLTVLNPNATAALVTASFYGRTGGSLGSRTLLIPALSRANLKLNDFLTADGIATIVTANAPVVVERPEYFGSPNAPDVAGSDVFGRNGAGVAWSFPGGDTTTQGGFASANRSEFLLIYNPSGQTVAVDATFYGSDGTVTAKRLYISPTIRYNVDVNRLVPGLTPQHGVTLRSVNGVGFVAEQTVFAPDFSSLSGTQGFAR